MGDDIKCLEVRMLGEFSMTYGGEMVPIGKSQTSKTLLLLQILLYAGEEGIARQKLLERLFGHETEADMSNNLRVHMYHLRKMLRESILPEENYIQIVKGRYYFVSSFPVRVDALEFAKLIKQAETKSGEERLGLLSEACRMYGFFLPALFGEDWVVVEEAHYQKMYFDSMEAACQMLKDRGEYSGLLELSSQAASLYPFEEWQVWQMEAMISSGRLQEAMALYDKTTAMYFDELDMPPSERMLDCFRRMSGKVKLNTGEFAEIQENLKEKPRTQGAYYCPYPSFVDTYHTVVRIMERSGQSVYLMLCTITDEKKRFVKDTDRLKEISDKFAASIQKTLRRGDVYTRYNISQYLVILMGIRKEECPITISRIDACFRKKEGSRKVQVTYRTASIAEMQ